MLEGSNEDQSFSIKRSRLTLTGKKEKSDKIKWVWQKLLENTKALELLARVLTKYKKFKIEFSSLDEEPSLTYGGFCAPSQKRVCILENLDETRTLATVIFELCNAVNDDLNNRKVSDYLDRADGQETYAKETEIAEFKTFSPAKEIYNHGIKHANYPAPMALRVLTSIISEKSFSYMLSFLPKPIANFCGSLYLEKDLKTNLALLDKKPYVFWGESHTDFYRKQWSIAKKRKLEKEKKDKNKKGNRDEGNKIKSTHRQKKKQKTH